MKLEPREARLLQGILNTPDVIGRAQPPSAIARMLAGLLLGISLALGIPRAVHVWSHLQMPDWSDILPALALMVTGGTALFLYLALRTQQAIQKRDELIREREDMIRMLAAGRPDLVAESKRAA